MRKLELLDEERAAIWEALDSTENIVLLIKASGGYKHRESLHLSDGEFKKRLSEALDYLRMLSIFYPIAESMLDEYGHPGEYRERKMNAVQEIRKEGRRRTTKSR